MSEQFANDFNTPSVLAAVFTLVRDFNRVLAEPRAATTPTAVLALKHFCKS
ncbi:MAG: hypothetical protein KA715_12680 [Xanthomonadaceae bacterium]|nr:hypothetical protein [Xanthomonadaceae bacterium]